MPPPITFTKNDVLNAAFAIVVEHGFYELSTRKVAEKLGSSPAPVYSCFNSKMGLEREVLKKIKCLLFQYATKDYTESYPLNMAVGLVLFARDYRQLFSSLFLQGNDFKNIFQEFNNSHIERMGKDERFSHLSHEEQEKLLSRLWIFTYGFANLASAGLIEKNSEEHVIRTLREVALLFIEAALMRINK